MGPGAVDDVFLRALQPPHFETILKLLKGNYASQA